MGLSSAVSTLEKFLKGGRSFVNAISTQQRLVKGGTSVVGSVQISSTSTDSAPRILVTVGRRSRSAVTGNVLESLSNVVSGSSAVTTQRKLVKAVICLVGAVCILRKIVRASIVVGRGQGFASTVNAP